MAGKSRYTIEMIREMFNEVGYDLISSEYVNIHSPLKYICRRHPQKGIQEIKLADFKKGSRCVYCRYEDGLPYNKPWPDDIIIEALDKLDCDFVGRYSKNYNSVIQFICRKHPEKGIQETDWTQVRIGTKICKVCNGKDRTTEDFQKMIFDINPNIEIISEYKGAREKVRCKCKIDGHIWDAIAYNLLSGYGCPKCGQRKTGESKRISAEIKMEILKERHPDIEFLSVPILSSDYVQCRCKICGYEWNATYSNLAKSNKPTGCPHCNSSSGEKKVAKILKKWNINFATQYRFDDLKDQAKLPFDFYLQDYNVLIEYDGKGHYKPIYRYSSDPDGIRAKNDFDLTVKHDNMKSDYCYEHNIPLIRIPYWHYDKITIDDLRPETSKFLV